MGRRALIIALASFLVIVVGAVLVWAIISSGTPSAAPTPDPTDPDPVPSETLSPEPTETPTPTPTPSATPTTPPADPAPAAVSALAAKPAPHSVKLDWKNPADTDIARFVIVQTDGTTPPKDVKDGTVVGKVPATSTTFTDKSDSLAPKKKYSYAVFARDEAGSYSPATSVTVTLPAALSVTPVDVTGEVVQEASNGPLTDTGSLAFTAFNPKGTRIAVVIPAAGVEGTLKRVLTEPAGSAPGAVAWTYTVENAAIRSLADGAKRDEEFVIELRDGKDKVRTTVTVAVFGINDAPTSKPMPAQSAEAGAPFTFPIPDDTFTDVDATDTLALTPGSLPGWLTFTNGALSGTPAAGDVGTTTVTITATDPHGESVTSDVSIEVFTPLPTPNVPPAPGNDSVTFDMGADPLQATASLLANDSDPDGGPNALAAIPASSGWQLNGELAGTYTITSAGQLVLDSGVLADGPMQKLAGGEQATSSITYTVTDGTDSVQATVNITVIGTDTKAGQYDVAKVFVPGAAQGGEPGRELGARIHG